MYPTKNTLPQKIRIESISILQERLFSSLDLSLQTKQAHWNVKGEDFIGLHKLFDKINKSSREWVDLIAERIVQLGGTAVGTVQATASRTTIPEYPLSISAGADHVDALSHALAFYGELTRTAISDLNRIDDPVSMDIFTEISRAVDQALWMVEAHNQVKGSLQAESAA